MTTYTEHVISATLHADDDDVTGLTLVGYDLELKPGVTCTAPLLWYVGESIILRAGATLYAPNLTLLGESIQLDEGARLIAPRLTSVGEARWNRLMREPPDESRHGVKHCAASLSTCAIFDAPLVTSLCGHVDLSSGAALNTPLVTTIGGDCRLRTGSTLRLAALARVLGELAVSSGATLDAPVLERVVRLWYADDAQMLTPPLYVFDHAVRGTEPQYAPMLRAVGWLKVQPGATLDAPNLTSVDMILSVWKDATLHAPRLIDADCAVNVDIDARLDAPALTTAKRLTVQEGATLVAPVLTTVRECLWLWEDATLHAPVLQSVGSLDLRTRSTLDAPRLTRIQGYPIACGDLARGRLRDVAAAALATPDALEMREWDTCATTHCIAGWAIALAGDWGVHLRKEAGVPGAAAILLGMPATSLFYLSNEVARERLQEVLDSPDGAAVA